MIDRERTGVMIVGAGPTGLVLALWLARLGISLRIIDKLPAPATTSRAVAVQARTLEFYQQLGIVHRVVARGRRAIAANMWVKGRHVARAVFGAMGKRISPYPYALLYGQDEHERMLIEQLQQLGVTVERQTTLVHFDDSGDHVGVQVRDAEGEVSTCRAQFLAGCDGAHSAVRDALEIGFGGGTYEQLFYVADVDAAGPALNGELHVALDAADFLAVFPLLDEGRARLVGTIRDPEDGNRERLSWDDVSPQVRQWMNIQVARVNWFSTYRVHHRVAERFRHGRAFLLGDAAHIHSPVGGQGMNTGIGDAVNLAWKLAAVIRGTADERILDSYEVERIAFARRLVSTTDQAFTAVTSSSRLARLIRLRLVPRALPLLLATRTVKRAAFRAISQTAIEYRDSWLSDGDAGPLHGGDRLPWVTRSDDGEASNYAPLSILDWQVHIYGRVTPAIVALCESRQLPLHRFDWTPPMHTAGLRRDALYLVRPDGYLAFVAAAQNADHLASYLDARRIRPAATAERAATSG